MTDAIKKQEPLKEKKRAGTTSQTTSNHKNFVNISRRDRSLKFMGSLLDPCTRFKGWFPAVGWGGAAQRSCAGLTHQLWFIEFSE
jgi:hypothetical protein